jgi:phosphate transport system permease protein
MSSSPPRRARLAVAGARASTRDSLAPSKQSGRLRAAVFHALLLLGLSLALIGLAAMLIWAVVNGMPRFSGKLFTNVPSTLNPDEAGFRTSILGSLYVIAGVILLIVPLGVGAAVYLEEYADKRRWWNRLVEVNIQNLAGVPSIVYGILGLAFFVRGWLGLGFVAAAGSLTLALLVLPTVILAAREALRAVPPSIREGALALGATKWQTTWNQVLPPAFPGILTGVILAVARAIGEAAPLLLVGALTFVTFNPAFFEGGYAVLPVQIYNYARRPQPAFNELASSGVIVMLLMVLALNSYAVWLRNRYEQKW